MEDKDEEDEVEEKEFEEAGIPLVIPLIPLLTGDTKHIGFCKGHRERERESVSAAVCMV